MLTLLSIATICTTFPPLNFGAIAVIGLIPLWMDLKKSALWPACLKAGLFGLIISCVYQRWILMLAEWSNPFASALTWCFAGLYCAVFYAGFAWAVKKTNAPILTWPFFWVLTEWLKTLGPYGNPSALLGHTQFNNIITLPVAGILGVWGLTAVCAMGNALIYEALHRKWTRLHQLSLVSLVVVIWVSHQLPDIPSTGTLNTVLIQPNHAQKDKLDPKKSSFLQQDYLQLLSQLSPIPTPNLICLPETITPKLNMQSPHFVSQLHTQSQRLNAPILLGSPIRKPDSSLTSSKISSKRSYNTSPHTSSHISFDISSDKSANTKPQYFNSAVLIPVPNENPQPIQQTQQPNIQETGMQYYHKTKLMPFGEYIPFRGLVEWINPVAKTALDYSKGPENPPPLTYQNAHQDTRHKIHLGIRICLESTYPRYFRNTTQKGAKVLILLANNAWFKESVAAEEHLQMSIIRAVENHRTLLHVTNTGISAIIRADGRVVQKIPLLERGIIQQSIPLYQEQTVFTRYPWIMILISGIVCGIVWILRLRAASIMAKCDILCKEFRSLKKSVA